MFNDDSWEIFAVFSAIFGAFLFGKDRGEKQMTAHYEAQAVIQNQQAQINFLSQKLEQIEKLNNTNQDI